MLYLWSGLVCQGVLEFKIFRLLHSLTVSPFTSLKYESDWLPSSDKNGWDSSDYILIPIKWHELLYKEGRSTREGASSLVT